jgi:hypothetical protein
MATNMAIKWRDFIGPKGGDWLYFVKNRANVAEFIKTNNIKPVSYTPVVSNRVVANMAILGPGFPGGLKYAHLHFNNRIYPLTDAQWKKFSGGIIIDARNKLAKANAIGFEAGMMLAEATNML